MKYKDKKNLHEMAASELQKLVLQTISQISKAALAQAAHRTKNTNEVKLIRRKLAVIRTVLAEKGATND